jgi:Brp/Blh family beta-carotene 15,15'-monooxygenase
MKTIATAADEQPFSLLAFRWLPLACLAVPTVIAAAIGPRWTEHIAPLPWIASLVFVGLPHGATDFAVSRTAWHGWPLAGLWLGYVVSIVIVAAGFIAAPAVTLALFVVLSAWHFGLADVDAGPPVSHVRALAALARGCAVLAPPLWFWPSASADVATSLMTLAAANGPAISSYQALALGSILGTVGVFAIGWETLGTRPRPAGYLPRLLGETGVIAALGCLTHPLFSVGLVFLVWHGWRQMEPLAHQITGVTPRCWRTLATAIVRIHAAASPLLVPTLAAIAAVWWTRSPTHSLQDLAVLSIGCYLVVTPAHELLGELHASGMADTPGIKRVRRSPTARGATAWKRRRWHMPAQRARASRPAR